jgi:hypothetical protein
MNLPVEKAILHCQMIQAGELTAIVGDASRDGIGGTQYAGLWSLTSKHRPFNAFGNSYAGLLPGEIRGQSPRLEIVNATTCALVKPATNQRPVDVRATYQVKAPYYMDHALRFTDRENTLSSRTYPGADFREVSWCCYMNCPEDSRIHFRSGGEWYRYISPLHGVGSNIAPSYVSDADLETLPPQQDRKPFHWDRIRDRFDEPFYYGRVGKMVLILIFDQPRWIRFFCSPSGGGTSMRIGEFCPAWDFEWIIPACEYRVGREYQLRMRLVYKLFVSDDDVLREYRKAQKQLGFEKPCRR